MIYENDQHSRDVLTSMLGRLGFGSVRATQHLEESIYFLENEKTQVDLIVSAYSEGEGLDFPLSRVILKNPHLDHCPLIVLTESWRDKPFSPFKTRLSRVDRVLTRPFGPRSFEKAVERAFEHRARFRSTLAFFGSEGSAAQLEEGILSYRELQWKRVVTFQDVSKFLAYLEVHESRLGGIMIEADQKLERLVGPLRQFKRSRIGASVPIASYGQSAATLGSLFTFLDVSFLANEDWHKALEALSRRSIYARSMGGAIRSIRDRIKKNQLKDAKRLLKEARRKDPERWELQELQGYLYRDARFLRRALETQPCSPFAYLSLAALAEPEERNRILAQSALYCPKHPELMALRK